jgi:hypothetical protein
MLYAKNAMNRYIDKDVLQRVQYTYTYKFIKILKNILQPLINLYRIIINNYIREDSELRYSVYTLSEYSVCKRYIHHNVH